MRYISTRGGMPSKSFSEILLSGLAPDGGLAIPEVYPRITAAELGIWRSMNYQSLAFEILSRFVDDTPPEDLRKIIDQTYTPKVFGSTDITPLKTLGPNLHILELSNGPTLAFKDIAMQLLGNLFQYQLERTGNELNILGATSGDTGASAEYAMRGKHGIRVFMLSPLGKMSSFQRAQMFSLQDQNIFNIAIRGVFDNCQDIVKAVGNDHFFKQAYRIGTVNSINWARIVAQVVYYFKGYFSATTSNNEQVSFAVPSGNFGNICAGHVARMMGLPIKNLIVATNENDVLDDFFRTGIYRPRKMIEIKHTSSPSMDISKASNLERFIFDLTGRNAKKVAELWAEVDKYKAFDLSITPFFKKIRDYGFISGSSNHNARIATIREIFQNYGVLVDTHTADGLKVGQMHREAHIPLICLETAQAAKFSESIVEAIGQEPMRPVGFENIEDLPQRYVVKDADVEMIKIYIKENTE